ncbi:Golgi-associated plant pathogenesis-related protein 1-like [Drosophila innubila]|uniref:Golgi-associated plant pathogenesis-related protein 1-like n=1 Tax=Drosophila innubila TaxID=198719 RepID=UPI00148CD1F9|nr:Golgi-associated plant pathogenesis-related protein 1-like [Drosophila innubila]
MTFENEVLEAHNVYRAKHNEDSLKLSEKLSNLATTWAKKLLASGATEYNLNSTYGQNIYMASCADLAAKDVVDAWYNQIDASNWKNPSQPVWKGSKELGVGYARRGNTIYVVCYYDPSANHMSMLQNAPK